MLRRNVAMILNAKGFYNVNGKNTYYKSGVKYDKVFGKTNGYTAYLKHGEIVKIGNENYMCNNKNQMELVGKERNTLSNKFELLETNECDSKIKPNRTFEQAKNFL